MRLAHHKQLGANKKLISGHRELTSICLLCANRVLTRRSKGHRYAISSLVASSDGGEAPTCSGIGVVGLTLRHWAGRDGHSEHLSDGRIVKPVLHFADGPDHAMLGRARVGGGLERRLVRAQARFLVYLGARIPKQNLGGDVAGNWLAAGVE